MIPFFSFGALAQNSRCEERKSLLRDPLFASKSNSFIDLLTKKVKEKKARLIILSESHMSFMSATFYKRLLDELNFHFESPCLFLESPSVQTSLSKDMNGEISYAQKYLGMKLIAVDPDTDIDNVLLRNKTMAKNITEALKNDPTCSMGVIFNGKFHVQKRIIEQNFLPIQDYVEFPSVTVNLISADYGRNIFSGVIGVDTDKGDMNWPSCNETQLSRGVKALDTSKIDLPIFSPDSLESKDFNAPQWNLYDMLIYYKS